MIRNGQDRNGKDNTATLDLQVYGLGVGGGRKKKKHEDQKTGCPVLPSLEDASASKEIRKLEGD